MTAAKIVCKERLNLNFISEAVKELLAEKRREGLLFNEIVTAYARVSSFYPPVWLICPVC
jgi:hypothetical protein